MTLLVRNEEDILEHNIEFHVAQGVDFFIIMDHRSTDDTGKIARWYEGLGIAQYIYEGGEAFLQSKRVTRMARMANDVYGADWVINSDADEFWCPLKGDLRKVFAALPPELDAIKAKRSNFVPVTFRTENTPFYREMIYGQRISVNAMGKRILPKVAHRGDPNIVVSEGNHSVGGSDSADTMSESMEILHFPVRSYEQFARKIREGAPALERNPGLAPQTGRAWRNLYAEYENEGNLIKYYQRNAYSADRIKKELAEGLIVEDRRLQRFMDDPKKLVADPLK